MTKKLLYELPQIEYTDGVVEGYGLLEVARGEYIEMPHVFLLGVPTWSVEATM